MVQRPNCLLQDSTTMSLNNKMYSRLPCKGTDRLLENEKKNSTRTSFLANKQKNIQLIFSFLPKKCQNSLYLSIHLLGTILLCIRKSRVPSLRSTMNCNGFQYEIIYFVLTKKV